MFEKLENGDFIFIPQLQKSYLVKKKHDDFLLLSSPNESDWICSERFYYLSSAYVVEND